MKKYILTLFFLTATIETPGQVLISLIFGEALNTGKIEFGLEGGYNWSNITKFDSKNYLGTFNLGFYFDIKLNSPWYIYTGVLVKSNLGTDKLTSNDLALISDIPFESAGEFSQVTKTFQVPILMKYRFENNFFILAGLQAGLLYNAWIEYNNDTDVKDTQIRYYNKDSLNRLDVGIMAGVGYKLKQKNDHGLSFSFRYYYGLVDVYKNISGYKYSSMFFEMTIPIGAN